MFYVFVKSTNGTALTSFDKYAAAIAKITGKAPEKPVVAKARLQAALRPEPAEIYFCQKLVLVEGLEDRAYLSAALHLEKHWEAARRCGLHIVPTDRKSAILQLLVIARELEIPVFVMFDADGDAAEKHLHLHQTDNANLMKALSVAGDPFPKIPTYGDSCAIWPANIEAAIEADLKKDTWGGFKNEARKEFDPCARLEKNPLYIAEVLEQAWKAGAKPKSLMQVTERIAAFAGF